MNNYINEYFENNGSDIYTEMRKNHFEWYSILIIFLSILLYLVIDTILYRLGYLNERSGSVIPPLFSFIVINPLVKWICYKKSNYIGISFTADINIKNLYRFFNTSEEFDGVYEIYNPSYTYNGTPIICINYKETKLELVFTSNSSFKIRFKKLNFLNFLNFKTYHFNNSILLSEIMIPIIKYYFNNKKEER
jgi:hypothetical protein